MAKANMKKAGFTQMFKKLPAAKGEKRQSVFSRNWRDFCGPTPNRRPRQTRRKKNNG
jgi:hypothetical protein